MTQQPKPNGKGWVPNLTPAADFGAIHYVFSANEKPWLDTEGAMQKAERVLRDFRSDRDYILWPWTGDPAALQAVMIVLSRRSLKCIRSLYWERKMVGGERRSSDGYYTPVTFNLK